MFLDQNTLAKTLLAGFFNGLKIGRNLRYGRKKYLHRFQRDSEKQSIEIDEGIRSINSVEEQYISVE